MKRRPERTLASVTIWANESGRMNKTRLGSLSNQYWQTLNTVGSIIPMDLENLKNYCASADGSHGIEGIKTCFASFRLMYLSLLYSVLSS